MDSRFIINPLICEQEENDNSTQESGPESSPSNDMKMASTSSPKRRYFIFTYPINYNWSEVFRRIRDHGMCLIGERRRKHVHACVVSMHSCIYSCRKRHYIDRLPCNLYLQLWRTKNLTSWCLYQQEGHAKKNSLSTNQGLRRPKAEGWKCFTTVWFLGLEKVWPKTHQRLALPQVRNPLPPLPNPITRLSFIYFFSLFLLTCSDASGQVLSIPEGWKIMKIRRKKLRRRRFAAKAILL